MTIEKFAQAVVFEKQGFGPSLYKKKTGRVSLFFVSPHPTVQLNK